MPELIERFDTSSFSIEDEKASEYSFLMLSDLSKRSVAIESIFFVFNHLKYVKKFVFVRINCYVK